MKENLDMKEELIENSLFSSINLLLPKINDFLQVGGPVVWILIALSLFGMTIVVAKSIQFILERPEDTRSANESIELWRKGDFQRAVNTLNLKKPLDQQLHFAFVNNKLLDKSAIEEEMSRSASCSVNELRSGLKPLEVIGVVSPLLGLLGTVLGMIEAFRQMEQAGARVDPSVLSGGIWMALLTTAIGLIVALPAVVAHSWLDRKVERVTFAWNDVLTRAIYSPAYFDRDAIQFTTGLVDRVDLPTQA